MNVELDKIIEEKIQESQSRVTKYRDWIKLDARWLTSSMNYALTAPEREVFVKLILLAAVQGPVPGLISDNDFRPMPHDYIAQRCFCPLEVLKETLKKGAEEKSLYENSHGIFVVHFDAYQFTEYDRQKQYRWKGRETDGTFSDLATKHRNRVTDLKAQFKNEHGRKPTDEEVGQLTSQAGREIYGENWRGVDK